MACRGTLYLHLLSAIAFCMTFHDYIICQGQCAPDFLLWGDSITTESNILTGQNVFLNPEIYCIKTKSSSSINAKNFDAKINSKLLIKCWVSKLHSMVALRSAKTFFEISAFYVSVCIKFYFTHSVLYNYSTTPSPAAGHDAHWLKTIGLRQRDQIFSYIN